VAENKSLARPYAEAIFQLAQARGELSSWSSMIALMKAIALDRRVKRLAKDPAVTDRQIADLFHDIGGQQLNADAINFVLLLLENNRLQLLGEIAELFEQNKADAEKTIKAEVISAFELTADQTQSITAALGKKFGRKVTVTASLEPSLIAGIVIRVGDKVIDSSVKGRLKELNSTINH